jgi:hypothetical protein
MQTLADYFVLSDGPFTLSNSADEKKLSITLPDDLAANSIGLLMYTAIPSGTFAKHFEVDINDTTDVVRDVSNSEPRSLHEAIDAGLLRAGANTVQFRYESGGGDIVFSDVVLWVQRNSGN